MNLALAEIDLPLRIRLERPMTDEELLRFCAVNDSVRIERAPDGELIVMTPAGNRTGRKNTAIIRALDTWAEEDGRGYAFDSSTGFTLPDGSMRSPDAAWIQAARWDALSEEDKDRFSPICPDFIIEIRSKSDSLSVLEAKMEQWIGNGAQVAWLVDPIRRAVAIYRPGQEPEVLVQPTSVQGTGLVAGFELVMDRIWA